jgi:hypothetical protein
VKGRVNPNRRRRGHAAPNEHPRAANMALLMSNFGAMQAAAHHAIVELRGFGEQGLADMLNDAAQQVAAIHTAAQVRLREVAR